MNLKGNLTSKGLQGSIGKSRMQGILGTNPAAIPITVDNALSLSSTNPVQNRVITAAITNRLWSDEVKAALLQIVEKVAFIDEDGQDYYDALYDALYPPVGLDSISAVFDAGGATIYNTDTLDDLKQYLTVTAYYTSGDSEVVTTYTLSGSMDAGTQTITVSYGGKTTTFTVTVVEWLTSISAVFTQGSAVIYDTDTLNTLKQYLTVTATYADSTTAVVTDYTLSGTLTEGTSTITVSYGGKTDTFSATVSHGFLYTPDKGLLSQQNYVNSSNISNYFTESISGDYLKIYSAKSGQSSTQASTLKFQDFKFSTSAYVKMEFYIADMVSIGSGNTATPGVFGFFVANDEETSSASFGMGSFGFGRYNDGSGAVRMRKNEGSGSAWLTNTVSLNTLHTIIMTVENGTVSVSLDGTSVASNGYLYTSTTYASQSGFRIMRANSNVTDIRIKSLEVRVA